MLGVRFYVIMIAIDWIKSSIKNDKYIISKHADDERMNDNLTINEIEESIVNGSILESYPEDKRGHSCLVVGFTSEGKPVHVVCGKSDDTLIIVTVYIPIPPEFKNPYERG